MRYEDLLLVICLIAGCGGLWTFLWWITRVEEAKAGPPTVPHVYGSNSNSEILTPCDYCGKVNGELLFNGWWKGDGSNEGLHVGTPVPLVLCRHCWEQEDAANTVRLERKVRVLAG